MNDDRLAFLLDVTQQTGALNAGHDGVPVLTAFRDAIGVALSSLRLV